MFEIVVHPIQNFGNVEPYTEDGTLVQYTPDGELFFEGEIVEIDAPSARIVVRAKENSPSSRPDESCSIKLRSADYLHALDEFAQQMDVAKTDLFLSLPEELRKPPARLASGEPIGADLLRTAQLKALKTALSEKLSFIWGPPGTGKTYTLGTVVANLRERGERVLLLAKTKAAVDAATLAADDACTRLGKPFRDGELLRWGDVKNREEFRKRPHLRPQTELLKKYDDLRKDLCKRIEDVNREIRNLDAGAAADLLAERGRLIDEQAKLRKECREKTEVLKKRARVLALTIASALFSKILEFQNFDAIVADEASLIPLAEWVYLTYRHASPPRIVVAGDPMQLQPILKRKGFLPESTEAWFARNIYSYVGLDAPADVFPRVTFLDEQSRMRKEICEAVSRTFYSGKLRGNARDAADETLPPLAILNVVGTNSPNGKNTNSASATTICRYVESLRRRYEKIGRPVVVHVLSAYKNQRKLLESKLFDKSSKNVSVQISTIHSSQGNEADFVVLDVSDMPESWFVASSPEAKNMWCVAASRAKCQCAIALSDPEKANESNEYIRALFKNAERIDVR